MAPAAPAQAQVLQIRVEADLVTAWTPAEVIDQVERAAERLSAVTGMQIQLVEKGGCPMIFYSSESDLPGRAGRAERNPCRMYVRVGHKGAETLEDLRCIAMHEMGHLLTPTSGFHSQDLDSFMYPTFRPGSPCRVTRDFIQAVWGRWDGPPEQFEIEPAAAEDQAWWRLPF